MAKITLKEKLQTEKVLQSGLLVSSNLIEKLEVYGYLNSCQGEKMKVEDNRPYKAICGYNNFVNNVAVGEVVCAGYLMQPVVNGISLLGMKVHKVYSMLEMAKESLKFDLAELDIPSLYYHPTYHKIKVKNYRVAFTNDDAKWVKFFPDNIKRRSEMGYDFDYYSEIEDVLCKDKNGVIKSIGDHLMAICRYLSPQTGMMCYAQFDLDELYVDEKNDVFE